MSYNLSFNLAFRGQVQLGVEGCDRAFGHRARPLGRPARLTGVSQCRWRVSAPAGRSSPDPARQGGRAGCGGEFAHAPAADQCSQLGERAPRCIACFRSPKLQTRLHCVVGIHLQAYSCNRVLYWKIIQSLHEVSFVLEIQELTLWGACPQD